MDRSWQHEVPKFGHPKPDESDEISSNEGKNILSSVRFSRLVDSRRISKDYYSQLLQQESSNTPRYDDKENMTKYQNVIYVISAARKVLKG